MDIQKLFSLEGRTAIVTGGGRGLGEYMAEALAAAGANIVLCSRKVDACEEVAERIRATGAKASAIACNVGELEDVEAVVKHAIDRHGSVEILVNNSGATWGAPAEDMPLEKFDQVMQVNVRGVFMMSQLIGRHMIQRGGGGSIVNIASVAAFTGGKPGALQTVGYSSSKGAVVSMTRELAGSWANHNIRVNAIAPGWFPTKMSRGVIEKRGEGMLATIPLGRFGEPSDIQGAILFLASDASAFVTGQTLIVDGGQTLW